MPTSLLRLLVLLLSVLLLGPVPQTFAAQGKGHDIVYIWDPGLDKVLDYQQKVTELLGSALSTRLRVVMRGKEYGLIYPIDQSARHCTRLSTQHNSALRRAGLVESTVLENGDYEYLYNVSYGSSKDLAALKKRYEDVYRTLGKEAGKDLFIEQSGARTYTLIYQRRSTKESSSAVSRRHATLLRSKNIKTSIMEENNHTIIFGESSYLNGEESGQTKATTETKSRETAKTAPPLLVSAAIAEAPQQGGYQRQKPRGKEQSNETLQPRKMKMHAQIALHPGGQRQQQSEQKGMALHRSSKRNYTSNIDTLVKELRKNGKLAKDEATGWAVYDLTRDEFVASINADRSFQSASMIKPFVALAYFQLVKEGKLQYNSKHRASMEAMIQRSDNASTNLFIRAMGGPSRCHQILQRHYGHIFKQTKIVEYIPGSGRTYLNRASPSDYIRFLRALWRDQLPQSQELRRVMSLPSRSRLYDGTPIPQGTLLYNKTGTTARLCGDMGILVAHGKDGKRYPYAVIGVIERHSSATDYGSWMASRGNVIRQVSGLVYQNMKHAYPLH